MTRERFIELAAQEQEGLRRFLLSLCGNQADADDLAQETLLKAYLSYEGFVERVRFSTWLYRIAYNCFVDYCRKAPPPQEPVEKIGDTADERGEGYRYENLYQAIEGLSYNEKTTLLLFYMEEKSILEISIIMHKPLGTVKSLLSRGREHLKSKVLSGNY